MGDHMMLGKGRDSALVSQGWEEGLRIRCLGKNRGLMETFQKKRGIKSEDTNLDRLVGSWGYVSRG